MLMLIFLLAGYAMVVLFDAILHYRWWNRSRRNGQNWVDVGTAMLAYRFWGSEGATVVVDSGLASSQAEWWPLAQKLADNFRVLTYDRPGYGLSSDSTIPRTPLHAATEMKTMLDKLGIGQPVILVGHSLGGLYMQQFARLFPERVRAVVLVDPMSADDARFWRELTSDELRGSGVDKTRGLKLLQALSGLRLMRLLRPLLLRMPPFCFHRFYDPEARSHILNSLYQSGLYRTALEEYRLAHDDEAVFGLKSAADFSDVPVFIITHSPERMINEIIRFGGLPEEKAEKIERLWQEIVAAIGACSARSRFRIAERSGHFIHLSEPELLIAAIADAEAAARRQEAHSGSRRDLSMEKARSILESSRRMMNSV